MSETHRPFTIIESPFSAPSEAALVRNVYYAMLAVRDSLGRGEAPYASHLLYTQMLDDSEPSERLLGIEAGLDIGRFATLTAVYTDLGMSRGMEHGIAKARELGREVVDRQLFGDVSPQEIDAHITQQVTTHGLPNEQSIIDIYARILNTDRKATS